MNNIIIFSCGIVSIAASLYSLISLILTIRIERKTESILAEQLHIGKKILGKTIIVNNSNLSQFEKAQKEITKILESELTKSEYVTIINMLNQKSKQGQINYMNKLMANSKKDVRYSLDLK